jgi:uncharacterized membrane protein
MDAEMVPLILIAVVVLLVGPILGIIAFVRTRKIDARSQPGTPAPSETDPKIIARIYAVEQRLEKMEAGISVSPQSAIGVESSRPIAPPAPVAPAPPTAPGVPDSEVIPSEARSLRPESFYGTRNPLEAPPTQEKFIPTTEGAPQPASSAPHRSSLDLEALIAGRWMNYVGIVALLFAVAFFLKYAFENNWIGRNGRVAIGMIAGAVLIPWSDRLLRRGYRYFSEGIAGLGAAIMYLTLWASWHYYQIFTPSIAFVGMIVITGAMVTIAVGRNSQRLAVLALAGGLVTPILVSTGIDHQVVLFGYLAVLAAGMLAVARARDWPVLAPLSFGMTQIYFWGWYSDFYQPGKLQITAFFATLFFALFAALPMIRSRREGRVGMNDLVIVVVNPFVYLLALHQMLWPDHRWLLALASLGLAALHLQLARSLPETKPEERRWFGMIYAGIALTFATLAIPMLLDDKWITLAWAVEGAVLVWSGVRMKTWQMRAAGLLLLTISAARLALIPIPAESFLFNARFAAFAVQVACFGVALHFARTIWDELAANEQNIFGVMGVAINLYALAALSMELWDYFGRLQTLDASPHLAQQLSLSLLWISYGAILLFAGMKKQMSVLRWQALVLIGIVVVKVFLFDLSFLDKFYRIVSFFVLGLALLAVSFLYQRKLAAQKNQQS